VKDPRKRLQASLRDGRESWYRIQNAATSADTATIDLYDEIGGYFGVTAGDFVKDLRAVEAGTIEMHVNSPGGDVFDGIAIMNALRAHPAKVVMVVDGLAASAASFIVASGDEVVMMPHSELMIHDAWGLAIGNAEDMRTMAADLDRISDNIASIYAARGGDQGAWRALMESETWYSAQEAVDAGLADRVAEKPADDKAKARFDLTVFNYAGRAAAPAPTSPPAVIPAPEVQATAGGITAKEAASMPDLLTSLRQSLGLAEDADEATVLAAHTAAMSELEQLNDAAPAVVPEGQVLIPAAALADLQASVATTRALADREHARERASVLDGFRDRFTPASRAAWEKQYDVDPAGTRSYLESAPVIVPLAALGADDGAEKVTQDDSWFPQYATTQEV
jgi:ATP-dependent Clp endopeptidase proteolytic subunit ClpP